MVCFKKHRNQCETRYLHCDTCNYTSQRWSQPKAPSAILLLRRKDCQQTKILFNTVKLEHDGRILQMHAKQLLLLRVQITISQHWFSKWLGTRKDKLCLWSPVVHGRTRTQLENEIWICLNHSFDLYRFNWLHNVKWKDDCLLQCLSSRKGGLTAPLMPRWVYGYCAGAFPDRELLRWVQHNRHQSDSHFKASLFCDLELLLIPIWFIGDWDMGK